MAKYSIKRLNQMIDRRKDKIMNGEAGKREKLIRAAMELFAEDGYDKVSIA